VTLVHTSRSDRPLWQVHLLMLVAATLVSTSFTVGKAITPFLDPAILTLIRFVLASLLFLPIMAQQQALHRPSLAALARYSLISGALVGFFYLMFLSLRSTTSLNTGVIFTLVPGMSGVYARILLKERLGLHRLIALALAMIGALWVLFKGHLSLLLTMQLNQGDLLFLVGSLLMALYTPLVKRLHRGEPMTTMTFWILVTGSGWLVLLAGYRLPGTCWLAVPLSVWVGIAYLAVFSTIVTFFISQWATLRIGPTRVMAYSYLYPPLILALDWCFGQELPALRTMCGILIILPAMLVLQRGAQSTAQKQR
jgi:drug/metabolite transporter (DMT)-like permease